MNFEDIEAAGVTSWLGALWKELREQTYRPAPVRRVMIPKPEVAADLNRRLRGWAAYFSYGTRVLAYRAIDHYVSDAVCHFLRRRHNVPTRGTRRFGAQHVFGSLGVRRLDSRTLPSAACV